MPKWQDSSHSLQEDLDPEMDSAGVNPASTGGRGVDGGIPSSSSWLVAVCGPRGEVCLVLRRAHQGARI